MNRLPVLSAIAVSFTLSVAVAAPEEPKNAAKNEAKSDRGSHPLTAKSVDQWITASNAMAALDEKDPTLGERMRALREERKEKAKQAGTDRAAAQVQYWEEAARKFPEVKQVLDKAGLKPAEFVKVTEAVMMAAMSVNYPTAKGMAPPPAENVKLVKARQEDIGKVLQRMKDSQTRRKAKAPEAAP